jgi:TP901 family phage tail tape measure protein
MALSSSDIRLKVLIDTNVEGAGLRSTNDDLLRIKGAAGGVSGSFDAMASSFAKIGAVGAVIAGIGYELNDMAQSAMKVDKGVREIGTLMDDVTEGSIKGMKRELGAMSIEFGQSMDVLTKARYDIVSSGFTGAADSALLLRESSKLAVGGVTEVSTAADVLTTVIAAYGMKAADASSVSDDLFTIVKLGKTTMSELGTQFGVVAAVAAPMGVSVDEVGAAMAALTVQGQSTSVATTSIGAAIMELSKPSKELVAALRSIGVETDNVIKSGGGLTGALDLVKKASEKSGVSVNKLVQREEALRAIMPLTGTAAQTFADDLKAMGDNAGATDVAFRKMAVSSSQVQEQAKAAFVEVKNRVGEAVIESDLFKDSLSGVKDVLTGLLDGFSGDSARFTGEMSDVEKASRSVGKAMVWVGEVLGWVGKQMDAFEVGFPAYIAKFDRFVDAKLKLGSGGFLSNSYLAVTDRIAAEEQEKKSKAIALSKTAVGKSYLAESAFGVSSAQIAQIKQVQALVELSRATEGKKAKEELQAQKTLLEGTRRHTAAIGSHTAAVSTHEREAKQAQRVQEDWDEAIKDADRSLAEMSDTALPTVAAATEKFSAALAEETRIRKAGAQDPKDVKALTEAERLRTAAYHEQQRAVTSWNSAIEEGNKVLNSGKKAALSVRDAEMAKAVAEAEYSAAVADSAGNYELVQEKTVKLKDAQDDLADAMDASADRTTKIVSAVDSIAMAYERASGKSVAGLKDFEAAIASFASGDTAGGIGNLANGIGQAVGGKVGAAISGVATGAMAGAMVGGPIGAVVGGLIGGVTSYFGADSAERDQRKADRRSVYESIVSSGLQGGMFSSALLRAGNYTYSGVAQLQNVNPTKTPTGIYHVSDQGNALLNDSRNWNGGNQELTDLSKAIAALDTAAASTAAVVRSSLSVGLDVITTKFEYSVATLGEMAELEEARVDDYIIFLTGMSVDNLSSIYNGIITSVAPADVGAAFAAKVMESIATSIREQEVAGFMEDVVMPALHPLLAQLAVERAAGADTADTYSAINEAVAALQPTVSAFTNSLTAQGIAGYTATDAMTGLTAATKSAAEVASERYGLETQLLTLQDDTVALRARELDGLDPSNVALQQRIWSLQDETAAVAALNVIASERYGLETKLLTLQGDTSALRARELEELDESNRPLQERIWALEDASAASSSAVSEASSSMSSLADSATLLQDAISSAMAVLTKSITTEKSLQQKVYDAAAMVINDSLAATAESINKLSSLNGDLQSSLSSMTIDSAAIEDYKSAQAEIFAALASANRTGVLPVDGSLKNALSAVSQDSSSFYDSRLEYQRGFYRTVSAVSALKALTDSQLTDAQQLQLLQQNQLKVLTDGFNAEIDRLDAILLSAQDQVDASNGTSVAVMSVVDAVSALSALLGVGIIIPAQATSTTTPGVSGASSSVVLATRSGDQAYADLLIEVRRLTLEVQGLRSEATAQNTQIAINTKSTSDVLEYWQTCDFAPPEDL